MRYAAFAACLLVLACSKGGDAGAAASRETLAINRVQASKPDLLIVLSPAFTAGGTIPKAYSDYGGKASPPIGWTGLPPGTKSLALVVEDPDAPGAEPFVHWLAWNIDPAAKGLAANGAGSLPQGRNSRGATGWFGPHPPKGPAHHYHFQLFALDSKLDLAAGADRAALIAAMKGHVIGKGELVGLSAAPK